MQNGIESAKNTIESVVLKSDPSILNVQPQGLGSAQPW